MNFYQVACGKGFYCCNSTPVQRDALSNERSQADALESLEILKEIYIEHFF